jgi:hypothetical protein
MEEQLFASPAPPVEPAFAERASIVEPATADRLAMAEEAATAAPATPVGPAHVLTSRGAPCETPRTEGPLPVRVLRQDGNVAFESYAAILPGAPEKNILKRILPFWFDERDFAAYGDFKKFCIITSTTTTSDHHHHHHHPQDHFDDAICYVYVDENHPSPLYALPLNDLVPVVEDRKRPDKYSITISPLPNTNESPETMVTVLLKSRKTNNLVHQFTFDTTNDPTRARRFCDCFDRDKKNKVEKKARTMDKKRTIDAGTNDPKKV